MRPEVPEGRPGTLGSWGLQPKAFKKDCLRSCSLFAPASRRLLHPLPTMQSVMEAGMADECKPTLECAMCVWYTVPSLARRRRG